MVEMLGRGLGSLKVEVDTKSYFLSTNLPFVVRDAHGTAVAQGTGNALTSLPAGLYLVTAVGSDGQPVSTVTEVRPGEVTSVRLAGQTATEHGIAEAEPPGRMPEASPGRGLPPPASADAYHEPVEAPRERDSAEGFPGLIEEPESAEPFSEPSASRNDVRGRRLALAAEEPAEAMTSAAPISFAQCSLQRVDAQGWEIVPDMPLTAVPTVRFAVGGRVWEISLPLNPAGEYPLNSCRVAVVGDPGRPRVSFAAERRVARFVDGLNRSGSIASAPGVLNDASQLLMWKYSDPPAAVLGALTLHRVGHLRQRADWIANLATSFPWLPDGQVLLAALLREDDDPMMRRRGLQTLLTAATLRPLYTDGLSLAMELLRRWPDEPSRAEREERVAHLAEYSPYADWDSVPLSVDTPTRPT